MAEAPLVSVFAQALYTDPQSGQWQPFSAGYSQLILYGNKDIHQYRLIGRNVDDNQFIINSSFTATGVQYQMATDTFHQYSDGANVYGFNFYSPTDAHQFAEACLMAVKDMLTAMQAPQVVQAAVPPPQAARPQQSSPYQAAQQAQSAPAGPQAPQAPAAPAAPAAPQPPAMDEDSSQGGGSALSAALGAVKLKKSAPPKEPEAPKAAAAPVKAAPAGGMMGEMAAKLNKRQASSNVDAAPAPSAGKPAIKKEEPAKAPELKNVKAPANKGSSDSLNADPPSKFGSTKKASSPAAVKPAGGDDWEEESKKPAAQKPSVLGKSSFTAPTQDEPPAAKPAPKSFGSIKPQQPAPQPAVEAEKPPAAKFPPPKAQPAPVQPADENWAASGPPKAAVGKFPFAKKPGQPAAKAPEPVAEPEPEPVVEPEPEPEPVVVPEVKKFNIVQPPKKMPSFGAPKPVAEPPKPVPVEAEPEPEPQQQEWEEEAPAPVAEPPKAETPKSRPSFGTSQKQPFNQAPPMNLPPMNMPPPTQIPPQAASKISGSHGSLSQSLSKKSTGNLAPSIQKATTETQVSLSHLGPSEIGTMKQEIIDTFRQELDSAKQEILDAFRTQIGQLYKDLTGQ